MKRWRGTLDCTEFPTMPRVKTVLQSQFPYNITARCINKEWFQIPMPEVWKIFCEELTRTKNEHELLIHSFILMSNHFHLIVSTPKENISICMHQFMYRTSRRLTRAGNRINETYAGRHYKCILHHHNFYLNAYKYNYRNPVAAKICDRVEEYPYSTLLGVISPHLQSIPIVPDITFNSDPSGTLKWLNTAPDPKMVEGVRFGLKRQYFESKKYRNNNASIITPLDVI